jgi:hypothetical protein
MRVFLVILGLALMVAGGLWWRHRAAHPPPVNASIYETDMTEHLVRLILVEVRPTAPPVCFLAFGEGGTPPSQQFLARFFGSQPAVRSYGSAAAPPIAKYFEVSTGKPGLVIHVIRFKEIIHGTFDVLVAFSNLPAGHDRFTYRVSELGGEWTLKSRTPG